MSEHFDIERVCEATQSAICDLGFSMPWRVRLRAAELLLTHLLSVPPEVKLVCAIAYGQSAMARIGTPLFPRTAEELVRLRDSAGPAMLMLGQDQHHALLVVDEQIAVELGSWNDYRDPGVLLRPFTRTLAEPLIDRAVVDDLADGVGVVYLVRPGRSLAPLNRLHELMARQLAHAAAPNVRWRLDAPPDRATERSA